MTLKDHRLTAEPDFHHLRYERRPAPGQDGKPIAGLYVPWILLNNPEQLNSYTTDALRELQLAFRAASMDRAAVAVVLTGTGERAFCSGGNTKEYAEYYAGRPREYQQYMRLFNDAVNAILHCDVPVVNRVNGLRVAGGQELGMACDFSIAQDLARFGQAGPRHGSAPDGGATDFLHLFVGIERAMEMCALCETWSAHKAQRHGLVLQIAPALFLDGRFVANPTVHTTTVADEFGRCILGEPLEGAALAEGKEKLRRGKVRLDLLDRATDALVAKMVTLFPGCLLKTVESLRKKKLEHWDRNAESNRLWLALNMTGEAKAGFRAFEHGKDGRREVDFVKLRRAIAEGRAFDDALLEEILP